MGVFVKSLASGCGCLTLVLCLAGGAEAQESERYDVVLRNGTIHPGDGSEPFVGHVGLKGDRIAAIEKEADLRGDIELDCRGLIVCPGFIDLHSHSDRPILSRHTRANVNYLLQGCTTVVTGNCGGGHVDVGTYLDDVDENGAGTHVAHLLPQGALRSRVIGTANRKATGEEISRMLELAEKGMQDGAVGMSTGLIYLPGTFTPTEELIQIAKVVARYDGIYASHIRSEGEGLVQSVKEAIRIGRESGTPVHVSHFKASGKPNWGTIRLAVEVIEEARAEGLKVTADQYPYAASSTSLGATLLPSWAREGGRTRQRERMDDPDLAARIRDSINASAGRSARIQIAAYRHRRDWIGKSLEEIAREEGRELADVVFEMERRGGASVVNFGMSEDDVQMVMPIPWVATASDGGAKVPNESKPHPRSFGTFPRKIGHYALELEVLPLAAAIRSASGLPAEILGWEERRGFLRPGLAADVTVFDPETFRDRATFEDPYLPPAGIRHVLVDGVLAVYDGQATGALAGKSIRNKRSAPAGSGDQVSAAVPQKRPADWSVRKLTELVLEHQGQVHGYSVDFTAYREDLHDLPIGVFDSGIGGLTVLESLLTADLHDNRTGRPGADGVPDFQNERFLYLGDQANMPYGNYPQVGQEDYLRELILKDSLFLLGDRYWSGPAAASPRFDKPPVKAIVIACNTATAYGLDDLRAALDRWGLPVITVGVVEAGASSLIDLLAEDQEPPGVAVMATVATCQSEAYPRAIAQIAGRRGRRVPEVWQQGSYGLPAAIEGDPEFIRRTASSAGDRPYRGPSTSNPQAPLVTDLIDRYGFDMDGILGDPDRPDSWRLNSVENYIRYDVTTLVERYREAGHDRPIQYLLLGCTHFPYESQGILAAFARLRDYRDARGERPYRDLIAVDVQLIDPAERTARELYRKLFLKRRLAPESGGGRHQVFVSVPVPDAARDTLTEEGWYTHEFKYGRTAGRFDAEQTRIVPLPLERFPESAGMLRRHCPAVWSILN